MSIIICECGNRVDTDHHLECPACGADMTVERKAKTAPAIIADMPNRDYHAAPGISCTGLKHFLRSPAHYRAYLDEELKETPALVFGRQCHMAVLEPDKWSERHAVWSGSPRNTKAGKAEWAEFIEEHRGREIITAENAEIIKRMIDAVHSHPAASRALSAPGLAEVSAWAIDERSGELVKCRPDFWRQDGIIVDLKTCESAEPVKFAKAAANLCYPLQQGFYLDVAGQALAQAKEAPELVGKPLGMIFLAVEKTPPFAVAVYTIEFEAVELGRDKYRDALVRLSECRARREWPGYSDEVQELILPGWAKKEAV